jgi:AAA domain
VEELAPLLSLPIIPELARQMCESLGYKYIGEIPDQEEFKRKVLAAQIESESRAKRFVSDRSTIDSWVLWQRWNIGQAMSYDTEDYYNQARLQAQSYTHVILIPPMFDPVDDGFRWIDKDYQKQIDRLVRMTLYEWNLLDRTYVISSETTQARLAEVIAWIDQAVAISE